jgi:hypothetical protein
MLCAPPLLAYGSWHRSFSRVSQGQFRLIHTDREGPRDFGSICQFTQSVSKVHNKTQAALAGLRQRAHQLSIVPHYKYVAATYHQA